MYHSTAQCKTDLNCHITVSHALQMVVKCVTPDVPSDHQLKQQGEPDPGSYHY